MEVFFISSCNVTVVRLFDTVACTEYTTWCQKCENKSQVTQITPSIPVLSDFDLNRKHRVSADASQLAVGAVLLCLNGDDWQPEEYASRNLSEVEKRYAMVEKKALAMMWAREKLDYNLVGCKFETEIDHNPLVVILSERNLSHPSACSDLRCV